jgi:hypothetical protein
MIAWHNQALGLNSNTANSQEHQYAFFHGRDL